MDRVVIFIITWLPAVFYWMVFVAALLLYIYRNSEKHAIKSKIINYRNLIIAAIVFRFFYATLESAGQYYVWTTNKFTLNLLNAPIGANVPQNFVTHLFPQIFQSSSGYFFYYAYGRFFLEPIIVLVCSLALWFFLKALKKYRDRFFDVGDIELGLIAPLIIGWPNFIIFLPLAFLSVIAISITKGVFYKEAYTTLGYPFLLAGLICLVYGLPLINWLNLGGFIVARTSYGGV